MEEFAAHFQEYLILGLLLALFFKEGLEEFIRAKMNLKPKHKDDLEPEWARRLQAYFNHDTTNHHEKTHEKLDKLQVATEDTNRTLREIKEYGIVCRDLKK